MAEFNFDGTDLHPPRYEDLPNNAAERQVPSPHTSRRHRVFKQLVEVYLSSRTGGKVLIFVFIAVFIPSAAIGAQFCASPCHQENGLAIILLIKGCIGLVFWSFVGMLYYKHMLVQSVNNKFFEIFTYIQYLFTALLILTQLVWLSLFYTEMKRECPLTVSDWKATTLNFSVFLTVMDCAVFITVVLFFCYNACDDEENNSDQ